MRIVIPFLCASLLAACASTPPVIDLSDSVYKSSAETLAARKTVQRIELRNGAAESKLVNQTLGDTLFPIVPRTPTKETVETDLRRFFGEALKVDPAATRSIVISINNADSYWVWGGAAKIPIIGLLAVGADTDFIMSVRVLIELEEGGKVVSNYLFDEKIKIQGKATTGESIQESYKLLIAEYRRRLFSELETRFVRRYL